MKRSAAAAVCRVLIASMMFLSFQMAHAGMIQTAQVIAPSGAHAERAQLNVFLSRADIAKELQALGVSADAAKERVAALSDQEVRALAGQLESLPAGGNHGFWILFGIVVIGLVLWWYRLLPHPPR
jgi:hypothetical protein